MTERLTEAERDMLANLDNPAVDRLLAEVARLKEQLAAREGRTLTDEYRQSHPHEYAEAAHAELNDLTAEVARLNEKIAERNRDRDILMADIETLKEQLAAKERECGELRELLSDCPADYMQPGPDDYDRSQERMIQSWRQRLDKALSIAPAAEGESK